MGTKFYRSGWLTVLLVVADTLCLSAMWLLSYYVRSALDPTNGDGLGPIDDPINAIESYTHTLPYFLPCWLLIFAYYGHYHHQERLSSLNEMTRIIKAAFVLMITTFALAFLLKEYELGRSVVMFNSLFASVYMYASRSLLRWRKTVAFQRGEGLLKTLIVGAGATGREALERIRVHPEIGYNIVGVVDDDPKLQGQSIDGTPALGTLADLPRLAAEHSIEVVFVAIPSLPQDRVLNMIVECEELRVHFYVVSHAFEVITDKTRLDVLAEVPVHSLPAGRMPRSLAALKRAIDLAGAVPLFALSLMWMVPVALIIRATSKGPIIFEQERCGLGGRTFTMYKFRTMHIETPKYATAPTEADDPRITPIGRFLRKYSLDEFPQLWNVIKGDMSLVGPRPEMPFIVENYDKWQRYRLTVKPGVTGLWQIIGRKNLPLELNMEYDLYYIKNQSTLLDLMILLRTVPAVIFGRGAF